MNRSIRILSAVLMAALLLGALGATGCSNKDIAAVVNGENVSNAAIDAQIAQYKSQYPQMFQGADGKAREDDFRRRLLDNEINQVLVKQEATKEGIKVSDAEVNKALDAIRKSFKDDAAFQDALKKNGMTLERLTEQQRVQLMTQQLVSKLTKGVTISEADMKAYYDKNKDSAFTDLAAVHAAQILFNEKDKALATSVLAQVKANPASFADLAKKDSKDTASASKGGDLGWPQTPYLPEIQKALDVTAAGQIYPNLVHSQVGWHILKVVEKRGKTVRPYAAVKDQVKQILLQQKQADAFQKLIDQLRKVAKITYPNGQPAATAVPSVGTSGTSGQ